jgi:hypothetical protein
VEQRSPLSPAVRLLLVAKAAAVAALVTLGLGLRPLDVVLWGVLAGLCVVALLALVPLVRSRAQPVVRLPTVVVLPDRSAATTGVADPAVQARTADLDLARQALLDARQRGAALEDLLALAAQLHEATLELARARTSAGGWVEPALRDELALRDQLSPAAAEQPTTPR